MKLLTAVLIVLSAYTLFSQNKEPNTVKFVDLKKYTGLWYEIAKIPNSFQDHCIKGTTAEYSIDESGKIQVVNSCTEEDGKRDDAKGVAKVVDKKTNSKLEVSFVSFLGIRPFWGDYWIIGLADDYRYAVVGSPDRKYGWILSRTPEMSKSDLDEAYKILTREGYDTKRFEMSLQ